MRIAYDGTDLHGFARATTPDGEPVRTVQGVLESALSGIYKQPVTTRGASRTDAGVHARGQVVAFDPPFEIPREGLLLALTGALPDDVVATAAWEQAGPGGEPLQPRFGNDGKHYHYRIRSARLRNPLTARYEWHVRHPLDVDAMRAAAGALVGEHDFAGFRASNCQAKTTVRRIRDVRVSVSEPTLEPPRDPGALEPSPRIVEVDVEGDAFLKNMVRIMVGTLVEVGLRKRSARTMADLIQLRDRTKSGPTAPARGLTLVEVKWPSTAPG